MPDTHPTVTIETRLAGGCQFLITADRDTYVQAVQARQLAFSWKELLALLGADPNEDDLNWALETKKQYPGVRIDDVRARKVTKPGDTF